MAFVVAPFLRPLSADASAGEHGDAVGRSENLNKVGFGEHRVGIRTTKLVRTSSDPVADAPILSELPEMNFAQPYGCERRSSAI